MVVLKLYMLSHLFSEVNQRIENTVEIDLLLWYQILILALVGTFILKLTSELWFLLNQR